MSDVQDHFKTYEVEGRELKTKNKAYKDEPKRTVYYPCECGGMIRFEGESALTPGWQCWLCSTEYKLKFHTDGWHFDTVGPLKTDIAPLKELYERYHNPKNRNPESPLEQAETSRYDLI